MLFNVGKDSVEETEITVVLPAIFGKRSLFCQLSKKEIENALDLQNVLLVLARREGFKERMFPKMHHRVLRDLTAVIAGKERDDTV